MHGNGVTLRHFQLDVSASYTYHPPVSLYCPRPFYPPFTKNHHLEIAAVINQGAESHGNYNLLYSLVPVAIPLLPRLLASSGRTFSPLSS